MNGRKHGETRSKSDGHKSKLTCILEAEESKMLRMESVEPRIHEDHLLEKEFIYCVHTPIPMPQAMLIPGKLHKATVGPECEIFFKKKKRRGIWRTSETNSR